MFKKKAEPKPAKQYLMRLVRPAGPCSCSWVSLGGEPWSVNTDTIIVKEGETLPPVYRGYVHYCERHGGAK